MLKRFEHIKYTWEHKKAFLEVEKELTGHNTISGYLHDLDKIIMYLIMSKRYSKIHRKISTHHVPKCMKTKNRIRQAIIDWECARKTKPDKPLNAYETCKTYYAQYENQIVPELIYLGLSYQIPKNSEA